MISRLSAVNSLHLRGISKCDYRRIQISISSNMGVRRWTHSAPNVHHAQNHPSVLHNDNTAGVPINTPFPIEKSHLVPEPPEPITQHMFHQLEDFVFSSKKMVVITGAGISTESGVPDYRSPNGSYSKGHKPVTYTEFVRNHATRQRYWARNMEAWPNWSSIQPNTTHSVLAEFEQKGLVNHIITQNVDRLHHKAGSKRIIELHGNTHEVRCLQCGQFKDRHEFQSILRDANPNWMPSSITTNKTPLPINRSNNASHSTSQDKISLNGKFQSQNSENNSSGGINKSTRADGDVDLGDVDYSKFNVPHCDACKSGMWKPSVVFFGENVPSAKVAEAMDIVSNCDRVLVAGSSLMVYSAFRFIQAATKKNIPIAIINIGPTRGDEVASLKVQAQCGEIFNHLRNNHK